MYNYDGITTQSLWLLARNRFENNKNFYEEHKEEIKKGVIIPMRQIAAIVADDMYEYDSFMELNPVKMVSRIRRDTRYTKDKSLYRENIWIMFMRPKKVDPYVPCFWLEVFPGSYTCGVGTFATSSRFSEIYRQSINENEQEFRKALSSCKKAGAVISGEMYKKSKIGCISEDLNEYYNMKNLFSKCTFDTIEDLTSDEFIDKIRKIYRQFLPMYKFLSDVYMKYKNERGEAFVNR